MADEKKIPAATAKAAAEAAAQAKAASAAWAERRAELEPHLRDSKSAFQQMLKMTQPHEHDALALRYGWRLLDLTCGEPTRGPAVTKDAPACGYKIADHVVDTRSGISDDLRNLSCPKCGARGAWRAQGAVKPAAPKAAPTGGA